MNNYEYIKGMTLEDMAIYFADDFHCNLCSEYKRVTDNSYNCDNQCAKHCKEWLENDVDDE